MKVTKNIWLMPLLLLPFTTSVYAESVEQRLDRIERVMESQSLLEMMERIDALQQELQLLRGQLEEQQHQMEGMKSRQRELYLDVDRRMSRIEREGAAVMPQPTAGKENVSSPPVPSSSGMSATTPLTTGGSAQRVSPAASGPTETPAVGITAAPHVATASDTQQLTEERAAYQKAFDLLRELRYEEATAAFRDLIRDYPNGRYAHIAQYWLGEAAYARRDFHQAIKDYQALLDNYPRSGKRADAMLKIGYSYQELKRTDDSKRMMERLIELYPDSTEAGQARNQLRRMKQSGG